MNLCTKCEGRLFGLRAFVSRKRWFLGRCHACDARVSVWRAREDGSPGQWLRCVGCATATPTPETADDAGWTTRGLKWLCPTCIFPYGNPKGHA